MKKIILSLLIGLLAVPSFAQDLRNNEIAVSYGISGTDIAIYAVNRLSLKIADEKLLNRKSSGILGIEYLRRLSPLVSVGGVVTYSYAQYSSDPEDPSFDHYYNLMPAVKLHWYQQKWFSAYSKCAAGIGLCVDQDGSEAAFDWQVSLLGLEVGRAVRLFTEAGVGDQGFVLAGLRVRF